MRLRSGLLPTVLLAAFVLGCSSPSSPGQVTQNPGSTVAATEEPGGETIEPGAGTPVANPDPGSLPTIADGVYAGGTIDASFTGSAPLDVEASLVPGASITSGGFTSLMYQVGEGQEAVTVQLVLDPEAGGAAISLTSPTVLVAGGVPEGCVTTVDRNDATGIGGTLTCPELPGFVVGSNDEVKDSVTATWSADR